MNSLAMAYGMSKRKKMSEGGEMASGYEPMPGDMEKENESAMHADGIVDRIMQKMSEGGRVANSMGEQADAMPAEFDDLALRDDLESKNTGETAGDHLGNAQEDEDRADIVARIMRQRSMKQRNPRPA